ncbi:MAG: uroporphyrinogen-III synthase, partial [Alphaproteobacteria bacterium]|nr:uroporphyrinogen-III synthase [Alphaproteobacteria bacterium]
TLWGVLFYSARTAEIFNTLVAAAGLAHSLKKLYAICLSDAIAATLDKAVWKTVVVAKSPTHTSLMDTLRASLSD